MGYLLVCLKQPEGPSLEQCMTCDLGNTTCVHRITDYRKPRRNVVNRPYIVMPMEDAIPFLRAIKDADPMKWNHCITVTYKEYGASVYLMNDKWTSDKAPYLLQVWATFFPHHMGVVKTIKYLGHDSMDNPIPRQQVNARISVVYQEYLDYVRSL